MAHWVYKALIKNVIELANAVYARAQDLADAKDGQQLNSHLTALESSMDILKICVSGLRYTVGCHVLKIGLRRKT